MIETIDVAAARERSGLRLVLSAGVPGPWGEAARGLLQAKKLSYARVRQAPGLPNDELVAWTGHANAPQVIYNDEPARCDSSEIIFLLERISPDRSLVPADPEVRATMFGLVHELAGEMGFGWSRRLMMLHSSAQLPPEMTEPMREILDRLNERYGYSAENAEKAPERVSQILRMLTQRLQSQKERGSRFFLGKELTALDVYWAAFAALLEPLPEEVCAMPAGLRSQYHVSDETVRVEGDAILLDHRNHIYETVLELPLDL